MGLAINPAIEIDIDRQVDLLISPRSTADRGMGLAINPAIEIDIDRQVDLLISRRSTADRGMGLAIDAGQSTQQEPCHV